MAYYVKTPCVVTLYNTTYICPWVVFGSPSLLGYKDTNYYSEKLTLYLLISSSWLGHMDTNYYGKKGTFLPLHKSKFSKTHLVSPLGLGGLEHPESNTCFIFLHISHSLAEQTQIYEHKLRNTNKEIQKLYETSLGS